MFSGGEWNASGRWFMTINCAVHAAMYTYYALRAMNVTLPHFIAPCITTAQMSQMGK